MRLWAIGVLTAAAAMEAWGTPILVSKLDALAPEPGSRLIVEFGTVDLAVHATAPVQLSFDPGSGAGALVLLDAGGQAVNVFQDVYLEEAPWRSAGLGNALSDVPEPAATGLVLFGLTALYGARRKRGKQVS